MSTPFDSSLLSGYLDGELDADELALVERVLAEQPERLRELERMRHLQRSLATLPMPQPTADPVAAVRARIEQARPAETGAPHRWWLQATPFALAACLLLAAGWMMFGSRWKPSQLASDRVASSSSEATSERVAGLDHAGSLSEERSFSESELSRLSRYNQSVEDFQSPENSSEQLETEALNELSLLPRGAAPQQRGLTRSEPASSSSGSRSAESEKTIGGGMGGAGGRAEPRPEADDAAPALQFAAPENAADTEYRFQREKASSFFAEPLEVESSEPLQRNSRITAVRLRYGVPREQHPETVRWLRTVVPRELQELETTGGVKRYLFFGHEQEQQDLQAAIKKRLEVTEGQLNVVQSADAALSAEAAGASSRTKSTISERLSEKKVSAGDAIESPSERRSDRGRSNQLAARPDGSPEPTRLPDSKAQPTAIIIELFAHPRE